MDVHASPVELPELKAFLGVFQVRFRRPEGAEALARYPTGLLTELPNKNCDTMAQAVPGTSEQRLQEFLTNRQWDEADLNRQRVQKMVAEATLGEGVLVLDDTGFATQGKTSGGVARQYSGTLGKVGNCQIAVLRYRPGGELAGGGAVVLAEGVGGGLGAPMSGARAGRGPLPDQGGDRLDAAGSSACLGRAAPLRRGRCRRWRQSQLPGGLEARHERYVVAIRADFRVSAQRKATGPVQRANALLQALPGWQWRTIRWRQGTRGWLRKKFVAVRCWRVSSDGPQYVGWLLGERPTRGQPEERKYYWSNLAAMAMLEELAGYAHRRYAVEQFHEEAKGELGWDQYQGRLWPGFHRHAVIVRSPDGSATKRSNGGSQPIGSSNSAHEGSNQIVLGNEVKSASPADFTSFLHSTSPPLPDRQGLHSQMAKVELQDVYLIRFYQAGPAPEQDRPP